MNGYTYTAQALTQLSNQIKECFIDKLIENKEIDVEDVDEFKARYVVVIKEKGMLGKAWDKWFKQDEGLTIAIFKSR